MHAVRQTEHGFAWHYALAADKGDDQLGLCKPGGNLLKHGGVLVAARQSFDVQPDVQTTAAQRGSEGARASQRRSGERWHL